METISASREFFPTHRKEDSLSELPSSDFGYLGAWGVVVAWFGDSGAHGRLARVAPVSTIFPKWMNLLPTAGLLGAIGAGSVIIGTVWYYFTPKYWEVGYMPQQPTLSAAYIEQLKRESKPVPGIDYAGFSHQIHAGKLGLDCRYCHSHVEESAEANIPSVSTCIGCHAENHVKNTFARDDRVKFIRDAWKNDESIVWRRVHKLPDYVRNFPHHVHVKAGVSCYSCHGNIMEQPVVNQQHSLSMGWCLECHRNPEPNLVPPDKVTDLYFVRERLEDFATQQSEGAALLSALSDDKTKPLHRLPENCGACHY
jgi:hypothetical protein